MGDSLDVRPYRPGDEGSILDLFERTFGRPMTLAFWRWRFLDNPAGEPLIELAWDGGVLAAHYAVSPLTVDIIGEPLPTALSMTTMTHPAYRGRGLFPRLAASLYERMARGGYVMVWGFPNDQSHRGFVRDLAWQDVYEIPVFRLELTARDHAPSLPRQLVELEAYDERFDALWKEARPDYAILVRRDSTYLNWRFGTNPVNKYRCLGYVEGGRLLGYAIFKQYRGDVDVVDLLAVPERSIGWGLVGAVLNIGRQSRTDHVNLWLPVREPLHTDLEKVGFSNQGPVTYLGARTLCRVPDVDITNPRSWYNTMGDSDVF